MITSPRLDAIAMRGSADPASLSLAEIRELSLAYRHRASDYRPPSSAEMLARLLATHGRQSAPARNEPETLASVFPRAPARPSLASVLAEKPAPYSLASLRDMVTVGAGDSGSECDPPTDD
jgi:hypothetical protein